MAKVLVVDDSKTLRAQIRSCLEGKQHQVEEASDGLDAWEKLSQTDYRPDLLLLDVNMPRLDGIGLCEKLQSSEELKKIPVFLLTTESNPNLKAKAKDYGVKAWILKPLVPERLFLAMSKVLVTPG